MFKRRFSLEWVVKTEVRHFHHKATRGHKKEVVCWNISHMQEKLLQSTPKANEHTFYETPSSNDACDATFDCFSCCECFTWDHCCVLNLSSISSDLHRQSMGQTLNSSHQCGCGFFADRWKQWSCSSPLGI